MPESIIPIPHGLTSTTTRFLINSRAIKLVEDFDKLPRCFSASRQQSLFSRKADNRFPQSLTSPHAGWQPVIGELLCCRPRDLAPVRYAPKQEGDESEHDVQALIHQTPY
jgi:hypothetical protein